MRRTNFDMDALRSFCEGMNLGSFAKAADRLGRSTSAVSMQLKKLEEQAGVDLLRRSGRGLEPTLAGEIMLSYARRIIELNDEARTAVADMQLEGVVRLGLQEDFGERLLTDVLGRFMRSHPDLQIEAVIARNSELLSQLQGGKIDLALAWHTGVQLPYAETLGDYPMRWVGSAARAAIRTDPGEPVRLVALQSPCLMRKTATDALDRAGVSWRVVYTSASLAGVWAAVAAGLGVTVRTELGLPDDVRPLEAGAGLPALPGIRLALFGAVATPTPACARMQALIRENVLGLTA
jgi:DNA-binding transcriptional LysR family regulator